jgi:hypothetical protein
VTLGWEESSPPYVKRCTWAFAHQDHWSQPKIVQSLAGAGFVVRREALVATGWVGRRFLADRIGDKLISGGTWRWLCVWERTTSFGTTPLVTSTIAFPPGGQRSGISEM